MATYVLIVENEPDIGDIIRRYLAFKQFDAALVASCAEARASFAGRLPDLIVLDWKLPDTDGDQWVVELQADPAASAIPIILMTCGQPPAALIAQMAAASIPIIIKPFPFDRLLELAASLTQREQALGADAAPSARA